MRNIGTVIEQIETTAPDLKVVLHDLKDSIRYSPPELMWMHCGRLMSIMNTHASEHPKADELTKIVNDIK